jgi:hypothetical protein
LILTRQTVILVLWIARTVLEAILSGAVAWAASRLLLEEPATIRSAYGAFRNRTGRLVGIGILTGWYSGWPIIPMMMVMLAAIPHLLMNSRGTWTYWVLVIVTLLPCLPLYVRYVLAYPATAVEDTTARESIKRSVELGRGYRWKVAWAAILPQFLWLSVTVGTGQMLDWVSPPASTFAFGAWAWFGLDHLIQLLWELVFPPLAAITLTLTYYDLRVRKEGLDILRMMEQAGLPADLPVPPEPDPEAIMQQVEARVAEIGWSVNQGAVELEKPAEAVEVAEKPAPTGEPV